MPIQSVDYQFPIDTFMVRMGNDNFFVEMKVSKISQPLGDIDNPHASAIIQAVQDQLLAIPDVTQLDHRVDEAPVTTSETVFPAS
ncbi:hypothetical protein MBT84_19990 [Streptomyces sp. MBT84]|uniref:hypothetical protein n=1 Tax=Streptomyces sp. MBT84 TaxID=1488414 RepID=UPI001C6F1BA3|nr:hypothetical protein [Streptomyces sp. MBT84]MBW8701892.1 hypothetical protein [Streptomyces sp. MBT84]